MQIIGKGFTIHEFKDYVEILSFNSWKPLFPVIHNTSIPSQALYKSWHSRKDWTGTMGTSRTLLLAGAHLENRD